MPSRDNKVRTAAPAASRSERRQDSAAPAGRAPANGAAQGAAPAGGPLAGGAAAGESAAAGQASQSRRLPWRSLKNWRVRSRLLLLIIIPTLTAVVLGGTYIVTAVQNALAYQRVEHLANLSSDVTTLAADLENERDQTIWCIGATTQKGPNCQNNQNTVAPLSLVHQYWGLTGPWMRKVKSDSASIGAGYPAQVQQDAANIGDVLTLVGPLRKAAVGTHLPVADVMDKYTSIILSLLAIDDNIALGSGDPALTSDVRSLNLVSLIAEEASEQRGLLEYTLQQDSNASGDYNFNPLVLSAVETAQEEQSANLAEYDRVATPQQVSLYNNTVSGSLVSSALQDEQTAIEFGVLNQTLNPNDVTTAGEFNGASTTGTIDAIRTVERSLVTATVNRATALRQSAIITASAIGAAVLIVLLLALILTTLVGRSMVRPLRRLRSGALEVAGVRLPETVRRMSESDGAAVPLEVEPIDVDSSDEIGEVARAFDQVHREALRLASNEAALRGNVNAMFVNLSRRSQSLVERQIRLIDDLEQGEQDPDRLSSLFQMDHLATRMRRNSENLLVLAGHDASRRWNQPVALVDVLRAAVSEIEQYERVTLNVQPGIAVRGHAVNDVVHLLAELAENATSFSSADTPVVVAGHLLSSGGVLLDITDQGVGMGAEEMAHANWRLDNPPVVDVAVSRRMGLFVVARLAARHGIRVRLRPAPAGGLTALVWLPDEVVSHTVDGGAPGSRGFEFGAAQGGLSSAGAQPGGLATGAMAALPAGLNGDFDRFSSPAEQEINAARMPKFSSSQEEAASDAGGLGPRRVPGAGLHPGNLGWGGAATTSPLPAFGSDAAEADLAAAQAERLNAGAPADFPSSPPESQVQPLTLGQPTVVGHGGQAGQADTGSRPVVASPAGLGGREADDAPAGRQRDGFGWDSGLVGAGAAATAGAAAAGGVVVPPAEHVAHENRLPIFEAVESDWFRRGRNGVPAPAGPAGPAVLSGGTNGGTGSRGAVGTGPASGMGNAGRPGAAGGWPAQDAAVPEAEVAWAASAADQGWEAAAAASAPATGGTTTAGLPKRVPQANLVPGTAPEPAAPLPARSASVTRERFASFQRGVREGRAAATGDAGDSGKDDGSR
ncbi:MAG TPA: nitrate- and nitrite sensing domain-containing protein [Streptosporangiaceae bacterium]|nr:nitrate- and nitrite sensing domain-containing protein [Streptosporangiaceae bacterium]